MKADERSEKAAEPTVTIAEFIRVIEGLPSDKPIVRPGVWYTTQKQHWLGWLGEYDGPGAYGRKTGEHRDARYAYNHVVCPEMLLWLIEAAGVQPDLVQAAQSSYEAGTSLMQKSGAIRKHVPWAVLHDTLWGAGGIVSKIAHRERWFKRVLMRSE